METEDKDRVADGSPLRQARRYSPESTTALERGRPPDWLGPLAASTATFTEHRMKTFAATMSAPD